MGSIFSLLTSVTVVIGLWATLSSGCPAQPPQPAGSYTLSDSHPNYYLRPVCEYRPGVWVYVAMATPSCIWLINGSQPSAYQPYAHPTPLSILLQPFEQNLMNTIITCITPTRRYNFVIGDVCGKLPGGKNSCIIFTICVYYMYSCVCTTVHSGVPVYTVGYMYMYVQVDIMVVVIVLVASHKFFWNLHRADNMGVKCQPF